MPDDDERHRDAPGGADAGWSDGDQPDVRWAEASAPDDISALVRDVHAYRREQRAARRRQRYGRFALGPTSVPLVLTVAALAVVAVVATLLTVLGPRSTGPASSLPIATTTLANGSIGGILPDVNLTDANGVRVAVQDLRPAVLAVLPPGCGCVDVVRAAATSASQKNIPVYAVVPPGQSADRDALTGQLQANAILSDTTGLVESSVHTSGLTLVLINRNGTIASIGRGSDLVSAKQLPAKLVTMLSATG